VGIIDRNLQLVYVNGRARTYTGQSVDEINDTDAAWIIHRDDQSQLAAARAAIEADAEFACELRLRRADGFYFWHSLAAVPLDAAAGYPQRWILTATNIEDRNRADAMIRESGARLARSAESDRAEATGLREANRLLLMAEEMAHVGHYRLDLATNEVAWSDEVYRTYGLPTTFVPNLEWALSAYHPGDRDRVIAIIQQALADGRTFGFSLRRDRSIDDALIASVAPLGWNHITSPATIAGRATNGSPRANSDPPPPAALSSTGLAYKNFRFLRSPRALRDGKVEIHAAHQAIMPKVILAHPKCEQTVEMSAAELERYRVQARERNDGLKQAPRRGRGR
jgi:PAS domain S-box-containing protein